MNVEINLISYNSEFSEPETVIGGKTVIKESPKKTEFKTESYRRFEDGKYFTSHKKDYKIEDINKDILKGRKIALRIRKLNLYNVENEEQLNV